MRELRNVIISYMEMRQVLIPLCEKYIKGKGYTEFMADHISNYSTSCQPELDEHTIGLLREEAAREILAKLPGERKDLVSVRRSPNVWFADATFVEYAVEIDEPETL